VVCQNGIDIRSHLRGHVPPPVQGVVQGEAFGSGGLPEKVEEGVVGELDTISDHLLPTYFLNVRKCFVTT